MGNLREIVERQCGQAAVAAKLAELGFPVDDPTDIQLLLVGISIVTGLRPSEFHKMDKAYFELICPRPKKFNPGWRLPGQRLAFPHPGSPPPDNKE